MFDEWIVAEKNHIPEPELVPILDALTCLIFFLLLSTTFIELTKITLPPSKVDVTASAEMAQALNPKFSVRQNGAKISLGLSWQGTSPNSFSEEVPVGIPAQELTAAASKMISGMLNQYPQEKNIQLVLDKEIPYQQMISVMDGIREYLDNIVLLSPTSGDE